MLSFARHLLTTLLIVARRWAWLLSFARVTYYHLAELCSQVGLAELCSPAGGCGALLAPLITPLLSIARRGAWLSFARRQRCRSSNFMFDDLRGKC